MFVLTEPQKAWLASAIDGEGTIYLHLVRRETAKNYGKVRMLVNVCNTNKDYVMFAKSITGIGYIATGKQSSASKKYGKPYKPAFRWMVESHEQVRRVLEQILPYLIIKRTKAMLVLDYIEKRNSVSHQEKSNKILWEELQLPM